MSLTQIAAIESIFWITVVVAEVPTGAIADRWGRRISLTLGGAPLLPGLRRLRLQLDLRRVVGRLCHHRRRHDDVLRRRTCARVRHAAPTRSHNGIREAHRALRGIRIRFDALRHPAGWTAGRTDRIYGHDPARSRLHGRRRCRGPVPARAAAQRSGIPRSAPESQRRRRRTVPAGCARQCAWRRAGRLAAQAAALVHPVRHLDLRRHPGGDRLSAPAVRPPSRPGPRQRRRLGVRLLRHADVSGRRHGRRLSVGRLDCGSVWRTQIAGHSPAAGRSAVARADALGFALGRGCDRRPGRDSRHDFVQSRPATSTAAFHPTNGRPYSRCSSSAPRSSWPSCCRKPAQWPTPSASRRRSAYCSPS